MFLRDFYIMLRSYLEARNERVTHVVAGEFYVPVHNNSFINVRGPTKKERKGWWVGLLQMGALTLSASFITGYLLGILLL